MIRRDNYSGWLLISQTDHSVLSGEIMKYWGNPDFPSPKPREEVLFAVREHDNGWSEWENLPKINSKNKYPRNFLEMNYKEQSEIWKRSYLRHSEVHPYASSLIALHFDKFNNNICKSNKKAEYLKIEIRNFLHKNLNLTMFEIENNSDIQRNLKYVQIGDIVSLALCHGWNHIKLDEVPHGTQNGNAVVNIESADALNFYVNPYPFNLDRIELSVMAKYVNKKTYSCNTELLEHLKKAAVTKINFRILNAN